MITVLLTGGIGSGKSAVAAVLEKRGVPVWDSDSAAKSLYTPAFLDSMEKEFGRSFRAADGGLDRKALSALIFADDAARESRNDGTVVDGQRTGNLAAFGDKHTAAAIHGGRICHTAGGD